MLYCCQSKRCCVKLMLENSEVIDTPYFQGRSDVSNLFSLDLITFILGVLARPVQAHIVPETLEWALTCCHFGNIDRVTKLNGAATMLNVNYGKETLSVCFCASSRHAIMFLMLKVLCKGLIK